MVSSGFASSSIQVGDLGLPRPALAREARGAGRGLSLNNKGSMSGEEVYRWLM